MKCVIQIAAVVLSIVCMGQAVKKDADRFDKTLFGSYCLTLLVLCIWIQEVL